MKRFFGILTALLPALFAAGIGLLFLWSPDDSVVFAFLGGYLLWSLICSIAYATASHKTDSVYLAKLNLWIIGGQLFLFAAEIVWLIITAIDVHIATQQGAMEGGLAIFLLIVFYLPSWLSYLFCRFAAAIGVWDALKETCSASSRMTHTILHIFPVSDLISAIMVYRTVKHCQTFQQPTIETE